MIERKGGINEKKRKSNRHDIDGDRPIISPCVDLGTGQTDKGCGRLSQNSLFYLKTDSEDSSMGGPSVTYSTTVEPSADGATVNGLGDWRLAAFPPMLKCKVKGFKTQAMSKGMPYGPGEAEFGTDIVIDNVKVNVKLSFPKGRVAELFPLIFATEDEVSSYRTDTYKLLAAKFFDGTPFASLSEAQKNILCTFANITADGTKMGSATYKEKLYFVVDLGSDTQTFNDLKFNQIQRVAYLLNNRLLMVLKGFAIPLKDVKDLYGLKLEILIEHKNFLNETAEPNIDKLEIYAPADLIQKFSDEDITSQQFIDGCVVIVAGNRISVPLAIT